MTSSSISYGAITDDTTFFAVQSGDRSGVYLDECEAWEQLGDNPNSDIRGFDGVFEASAFAHGSPASHHVFTSDDVVIVVALGNEGFHHLGPDAGVAAKLQLAIGTGSVRAVRRALEEVGLAALGAAHLGLSVYMARRSGLDPKKAYRINRCFKDIEGRQR